MQTLSTTTHGHGAKRIARMGQINFINSLPVVIPLTKELEQLNADIMLGTPSELNKMYAEQELELGAMSSFYFLKSGALDLIRGLSISSVGEVGSVLFFSKKELSQLDGSKIVVPESSATSINLLHVLLMEEFGVKVQFESSLKPDLKRDDVDAALVIGDRALLVDSEWTSQFKRIDMGAWWYQRYLLPMTFGVWAARSAWITANRQDYNELSRTLGDAPKSGLTRDFADVIAESIKRLPLSQERLEHYFRHELNFEFTPAHESGLNLYRDLCIKHSLLRTAE